MRTTFLGWISAATLGALMVAGCSSGGGDASSFHYDPPPGGPPPPAMKSMEFDLPAYNPGDQAVLVFTPVSEDEFDETANTITVNSLHARAQAETRQARSSAPSGAGWKDRCGMSHSVARFEEMHGVDRARARSEALRPRAVKARWDGLPKGSIDTLISPMQSDPEVTIDVTKVLDDSQTVRCNILAEPGLLTEADAQRIAQIFDSSNPFDPSAPGAIGLYDRITGLCGHEWNSNPVGGLDGDTRVNLVFCSAATMGEGLSGLVRFEDSFTSEIAPSSNQGEYVYINYEFLGVPGGSDLQNYSLYHTLAHEFLHVVQMNTKVGQDGTFPDFDPDTPDVNLTAYLLWERRTMAEGFCETMATLCGFGVHRAMDSSPTGGAEGLSYDAINMFLGAESVFFPGVTGPTTLGSNFWTPFLEFETTDPYGIGHLFGLHLVNKYGAATWGRLTSSHEIGLENLSTVLGEEPELVFHDFNISLHASSLTGTPAKYDLAQLRPGGVNYYRDLWSEGNPLFHVLPAAGFVSSTPATANVESTTPPWATILLRFLGGEGRPLSQYVILPAKAQANLIYESPAGVWHSLR